MNIPDGAKVGLIGLIFNHNNAEMPWLVDDTSKAPKFEHPCVTKADVLDKILPEILDDMSHPTSKLERDNDDAEVVVAVTLQASLCDLGNAVEHARPTGGSIASSSKMPCSTMSKRDSPTPLPTRWPSACGRSEPWVWNRGGFLRPPFPPWRLCNAERLRPMDTTIVIFRKDRNEWNYLRPHARTARRRVRAATAPATSISASIVPPITTAALPRAVLPSLMNTPIY